MHVITGHRNMAHTCEKLRSVMDGSPYRSAERRLKWQGLFAHIKEKEKDGEERVARAREPSKEAGYVHW
jgi:hypothetical protein